MVVLLSFYLPYWVKFDHLSDEDGFFGIALSDSGYIYVAGRTGTSTGTSDMVLAKYDSSGNTIFLKSFDFGNDEIFSDVDLRHGNPVAGGHIYTTSTQVDGVLIEFSPDGNPVHVETLPSFTSDVYGVFCDSLGGVYASGDGWIIKYNSLWQEVWCCTLTGIYVEISDVVADESLNVYGCGMINNGVDNDFFLVKLNREGKVLWADTISLGVDERAWGLDVKGGKIFAGGVCMGTTWDILLGCWSKDGDSLWFRRIDSGGHEAVCGIECGEMGILATGYMTGATMDGIVMWVDTLGNPVWMDTLDYGNSEYLYAVAQRGRREFYVTGYSYDGSARDFLTVEYVLEKDLGICSILSPSRVEVQDTIVPRVVLKNLSPYDTLECKTFLSSSFFFDSAGSGLLSPGGVETLSFSPVVFPEISDTYLFVAWISPGDLNPENDTLKKKIFAVDTIPLSADSAVAHDGTRAGEGVDDDDFVVIYFPEPTNTPGIDYTTIDSVLRLSSGHSWRDGGGAIGGCYWGPDGKTLLIALTTYISPPTVTEGDTIYPDGKTITDINGNPWEKPVVIGGSFTSQGVKKKTAPLSSFIYIPAGKKVEVYSVDGRKIGKYFSPVSLRLFLPPGIYIVCEGSEREKRIVIR